VQHSRGESSVSQAWIRCDWSDRGTVGHTSQQHTRVDKAIRQARLHYPRASLGLLLRLLRLCGSKGLSELLQR
jgi:hypothetical protein